MKRFAAVSFVFVLALALSGATAQAQDYYTIPTIAPNPMSGMIFLAPPVPCYLGHDVSYNREIFHYPAHPCVPPVMGYEYLYNPCKANTPMGYARMFDF